VVSIKKYDAMDITKIDIDKSKLSQNRKIRLKTENNIKIKNILIFIIETQFLKLLAIHTLIRTTSHGDDGLLLFSKQKQLLNVICNVRMFKT